MFVDADADHGTLLGLAAHCEQKEVGAGQRHVTVMLASPTETKRHWLQPLGCDRTWVVYIDELKEFRAASLLSGRFRPSTQAPLCCAR